MFNRLNIAICAYRMGERVGLAAEFAALFERLEEPPRHHAAVMVMLCRHAEGRLPEAWRFVVALGRPDLLPWDLPSLPTAVTREYAEEELATDSVVDVLEQLLAAPGGSPEDRQCAHFLLAAYAERVAAEHARSKGSWLDWLKRITSSKKKN